MSSLERSAERDGLANARSIVVFIVNCFKDKESFDPSFFKYSIIEPTSQKDEYLGCGGLELNTLFRILVIVGWLPTLTPSTISWVDDIAERYTFGD